MRFVSKYYLRMLKKQKELYQKYRASKKAWKELVFPVKCEVGDGKLYRKYLIRS